MSHDAGAEIAVLGIDAAWTPENPSGVALVERVGGTWHCVEVAPSYQHFVGLDKHLELEAGVSLVPCVLLTAYEKSRSKHIQAVAVDMPLSRKVIEKRRVADDEISRMFGKAKCGTHSPNKVRPGLQSALLRDVFLQNGFSLATTSGKGSRGIFEVYPHVALLTLLGEFQRLPYKVCKSRSYWPTDTLEKRKTLLLDQFGRIHRELSRVIKDIPLGIPEVKDVPCLAALKSIEDQLDALVCAWMAIKIVAEEAKPIGDDDAAIWIPT